MKSDREINVFSISFLDVFCNALGVMILLFVLNSKMLTGAVEDMVSKYKQKVQEAQEEKDKAINERTIAQIARNEAQEARNMAIDSKNKAEKAEEQAKKSEREALLAKQDAEKQKNIAIVAKEESTSAKENALVALKEAKEAKEKMEKAYSQLKDKNQELQKINQALQKAMQESQSQDKRIESLVKNNESLQKTYQNLEREKQTILEEIESIKAQKEQMQKDREDLEKWYKETKEKADQLSLQYKGVLDQNSTLASRLSDKGEELRRREKEIVSKERQIQDREREILNKEKQIQDLKSLLEKKVDKSLFGIQLKYSRIVFLFDRSGSIVQNKWKEVIIGTCEEILRQCEVEQFAIVAFSADMLFYPPRRGLMAGGGQENIQKAIHWLKEGMDFGSYTHLHDAIKIAYEEYPDLDAIFILSDGLPTAMGRSSISLQQEILQYVTRQSQEKKTKIITMAIGYPPADAKEYAEIYNYLNKIAKITGGQYLGR